VPAPAPVTTSTTNPDDLFLTDIQLTAGRIIANSGGDVATVTGYANLNQALSNRLNTPRGRLMMHPKYGSLHQRMKGVANGPTQGVLTANYARGAVKADPRVSSIVSASAQITGDATEISIVAQPISGGPTTTVTVTSK
jgi:phage baseplate assembly protein W